MSVYKITGVTQQGKGFCGHTIKKNEPYLIVRDKDELHALCMGCKEGRKINGVLNLPDVLNEQGLIPLT